MKIRGLLFQLITTTHNHNSADRNNYLSQHEENERSLEDGMGTGSNSS